MTHFNVTVTFDKDIKNKTNMQKIKKEIYDKIFRVEWLWKEIYFNKSNISCKGDKAFIKFKSIWPNSRGLVPKIKKALQGRKSKLYLDESLKVIKLKIDVKEDKKTKRKGGGKKTFSQLQKKENR